MPYGDTWIKLWFGVLLTYLKCVYIKGINCVTYIFAFIYSFFFIFVANLIQLGNSELEGLVENTDKFMVSGLFVREYSQVPL